MKYFNAPVVETHDQKDPIANHLHHESNLFEITINQLQITETIFNTMF